MRVTALYLWVAALAALSGCSASSPTPANSQLPAVAQSSAVRTGGRVHVDPLLAKVTAVPPPFAHAIQLPTGHGRSWMKPEKTKKKTGKPQCIYLSDEVGGTVRVYAGHAPYAQIGSLSSASEYGWGVAANKQAVFIGTYADTIDEYTPCSGTTPIKSLTGTAQGYPYGIAAAKDGTVYATEWPSAYIDIFDPSGHLTQVDDSNDLISAYFVAVDQAGNIFVSGTTQSSGGAEGGVDKCDSSGRNCAATGITITFPGGLAFGKREHLYVDDQFGTLYEYAPPYGPSNLVRSFAYSTASHPLAYTAIAIDKKGKSIWGANIYCAGFPACTDGDAQQNYKPIGSLGQSTPYWSNAQPYGLALWRPSKY